MVSSSTDKILLSADGVPLKKSLNRSLRQQKIRALLLILPLLIFFAATIVFFIIVSELNVSMIVTIFLFIFE